MAEIWKGKAVADALNEKMAAEMTMATCGFIFRIRPCCSTPRKVNSSPMAGINAITSRLPNKPQKVST